MGGRRNGSDEKNQVSLIHRDLRSPKYRLRRLRNRKKYNRKRKHKGD